MNAKNKIKERLEYFIAVFLVYSNSSWAIFENKTSMLVLLPLLLIFYLFNTGNSNSNRFSKPNIVVFFFALYPILSLVANLDKEPNFVSTISVSLTYIILGFFPLGSLANLLNKFAHVIFVLACVSLILGPITLIDYSFLSRFRPSYNDLFNSDGYGYYNLYIYTDRVINDFRTQSIFWEPGAWAFNQIFAFYWFLIVKKDLKKIPIFLFSLFLTFSTTGLFLTFFLFFVSYFSVKDIKFKKKIRNVGIITFAVLIGSSVYISNSSSIKIGELLHQQVVSKFRSEDEASVSFDRRTESSKNAFKIAYNNPVFGIGKTTAENQVFVTSSLAELAYQLGFIYLIVYLFIFRMLFRDVGFINSFIFILVMLNGEAYAYWILCSLILIYGSKKILIQDKKALDAFHDRARIQVV